MPLGMLARADAVGQPAEQRASARGDRARAPRRRRRARPPGPCPRSDRWSSSSYDRTTCPSKNRSASARRHDAGFGRVAIERLEPGALVVAEMVLDIIPQVARADRLMLRRVRGSTPRAIASGWSHAGVPRLLQRRRRRAASARPAVRPRTHRRTAARSSPSTPRRDRSSRRSTVGRRRTRRCS